MIVTVLVAVIRGRQVIGKILFGRTGGHWLFWSSAIYMVIGVYCALYYRDIPAAAVQLPWLFVIAGPLLIPPLGRWLNMSIDWDRRMFNFFKSKKNVEDAEKDNVVDFSKELKSVPQVKAPEPPKEKEPEGKIFYRLGLTDNNRVAFSMGYSEITMNHAGCQQMIDQIEFFQSQLREENPEGEENV